MTVHVVTRGPALYGLLPSAELAEACREYLGPSAKVHTEEWDTGDWKPCMVGAPLLSAPFWRQE